MEKLSLYDLLSFLLPGAVATILLDLLFDSSNYVLNHKIDPQYDIVVFLCLSFFAGSIIHYFCFTKFIGNVLRFFGLNTSIQDIYEKSGAISPHIKDFYEKKITEFQQLNYKRRFDQFEELWSEVYFELEANNQITVPKSFQSFYFFFRNVFFLSIITLLVSIILQISGHIDFSVVTLIKVIGFGGASIFAGRMHRKKMVERMFWTYYILKK